MNWTRAVRSGAKCCAIVLGAAGVALAAQQTDEVPTPSGLEERVTRRLVQFDVSVSGPPDVVGSLGPGDFELSVLGRVIDDFFVDSLCRPAPGPGAEEEPAVAPEQVLPPVATRSYLLYFDQSLMSFTGRSQSIRTARELVGELFAGPARVMVVSSARSVEFFSEWVTSPAEVLEALDRIDADRAHWDSFGAEEENRVEEILGYVARGECAAAKYLARRYESDEMATTKRAMERLASVMPELDEWEPPRIVLYFSDLMRKNAGEHYFKILGPCLGDSRDVRFTRLEFSMARLIGEAALSQVRVYPIQAQGLSSKREVRFDDTKSSLVTLGLETGGRAFLEGAGARFMTDTLREDLSCLYLISFDPDLVPKDKNLTVTLRSTRKGVRVRTRGVIAAQSAEQRRISRLVRAFVLGREGDPAEVRVEAAPLGYADGKFQVLFQGVVPAPGVVEGTWDFGVSVVRQDKVTHERSGRVEGVAPDVPLVVESVLDLKSGSHEIVGVFHEPETERTLSAQVEQVLDLPKGELPAIVDLKLLADLPGIYWRDGVVSRSGKLIVPDGGAVSLGSRVSVQALVCRDPELPAAFLVRRALRGLDGPKFDKTMELNLEQETCIALQDALPASWLTAGEFTFYLAVQDGERVLAERSATFGVER